jgi:hypothetical protein
MARIWFVDYGRTLFSPVFPVQLELDKGVFISLLKFTNHA